MLHLFRKRRLLFLIGAFCIVLLFCVANIDWSLQPSCSWIFDSKGGFSSYSRLFGNRTITELFFRKSQKEISREQSEKIDQLFRRRVEGVNCKAFFEDPRDSTSFSQHSYIREQKYTHEQHSYVETPNFLEATKNCSDFITSRGYITQTLTEEEEQFPIAFSILVFKDISRVERLLRAIYRPQHRICIHADKKSHDLFKIELAGVVSCFPNVFLAPRSVDVQWGTFTVLEPELICLESLWKYKKWKYFINLTGQEFPLKTNLELVRILKAYSGANDLEGTVKRANPDRWQKAGLPPHDIRPVKGSIHMVVNREFVDYVLHNQTAKDLLAWVKKTGIPDETYFSTLNHNPQLQIPGSYIGDPETSSYKPFLARYKQWYDSPCAGKKVHAIWNW